MRNLRNLRFNRWGIDDISKSHHDIKPAITATCWDAEKDAVLCIVGPTESGDIELARIGDDDKFHTIASWSAPSPNPDLPVDKVVSFQHLSGTGMTCIVLEGGDIVTVQEDSFSSSPDAAPQIEIIGSIDSGIAAARWSPDEELLIVVTKEKNVIFMGSTFDPVTEIRMTSEDLKASKHVSVGWGKKETQFQGKGARALRDPTIPERVDEGVLSAHDDRKTTISWRGDGAYVAISDVAEGERRVIRVYNREGELDSASEPVDGLESTISWRPSGNLIASVQRLSDRVDVAFFERNGLRHGQFTLRSTLTDINAETNIRLEWNSDSTVLAVLLKDTVQFWTTGNYHWYLKQEVPQGGDITSLAWHSEKALKLAVSSLGGVVNAEYIFHTARGGCRPPLDTGVVAVLDGQTVKLTGFRTANVPPPMAQFEIEIASAAVDITFGKDNVTFAVLHRKGVDVYEWPVKNGRSVKPQLKYSSQFEVADTEYSVPLSISSAADGFVVLEYQYSTGHTQRLINESGFSSTTSLDQQLSFAVCYDVEGASKAYAQDRSGKLYGTDGSSAELLPTQFRNQLPWFEVVTIDETEVAFGLSRNGNLYANSRLLVKNCTSFVLTPAHLIFTTNNHYVKYVHLLSEVEDLDVPGDDPEADERCRSVERGSRLVTAMPTTMCIVLQMPRGNLETIYPRAMVLAGIRNLVDEKDYARAFSFCRTQRVDMNILYDHQPAQFLANVGLFLDQLKNISYIDLFLSSLREEDVTQTMYQDTKRRTQAQAIPPPTSVTGSKINTVCDALLSALLPRKSTNLQNIITAHVCKSPPALDDGLLLVSELMREADKTYAENAIEHICFLVDVNRLYDNALGLYNLELALLVAQQSQRDPREYVPFIQGLHEDPELRRKFRIDDHLTRKEKALGWLKELDAFDELCDYTAKHTLYHEALKLYRYDTARHATLTNLYAQHLEATSQNREAGLAYESLQNFAKATDCYRTAGASCWQECLFSAKQQQDPPLAPDNLAELASTLADALWEAKDYEGAAHIHAEYLDAPEQAIKCLCKGYHFASAMRLVSTLPISQSNLLSAVDTGLAEALSSTTEFLADCKGQLAAQVPRILDLRRKALEDPLGFYEGERPAGMEDIPDDISVAASSRVSTSASLFTRYTGKAGSQGTLASGVSRATSKNRKREEKKRARGRKGTVYEEEYLVNSVRRLVERVEGTKVEVERLVFALVRRGMQERGRAAEALLGDVLAACEKAVGEVFVVTPAQQQQLEENDGVEGLQVPPAPPAWRPLGADAVLQDWEAARMKKLEPPVISKMKKLTLLGS